MTRKPITAQTYGTFQQAYDFFNARLWAGALPGCLITLQRHKGARGYFSPQRFSGRAADDADGVRSAHELAMNPDAFGDRTDREIVSTLVHEMTHVWQQEHGTPSRNGYHNREWGAEMKRCGLYPSSTGEPGGKEVGQRMTHYIEQGGAFDTLWAELESTGFRLEWQSTDVAALGGARAAKKASKTKYTCPECSANAWAKPDASLLCGECSDDDALVRMVGEPTDDAGADDEQ